MLGSFLTYLELGYLEIFNRFQLILVSSLP